ncbi:shikimate kinase [Actinomyces bowdenii]|uniref:shikimate kinase n=1 Tax=Actinomyces bowdenii TaxID=131109 RepID=UPI0035A34164
MIARIERDASTAISRYVSNSVCLIGPRSVGKSEVARLISTHFNMRWLDTDVIADCALKRQGTSLDAVMRSGRFGVIHAVLAEELERVLDWRVPVVLSAAGGMLWDAACTQLLAKRCFVVGILPSLDLEDATQILVARDLRRQHFAGEREATLRRRINEELRILMPCMVKISDVVVVTDGALLVDLYCRVFVLLCSAREPGYRR